MSYQNLQFLQNLFLNTQNINSWSLSLDLKLLYTNCPEQDFFFSLFSVSQCKTILQQHFVSQATPLIATDRIGFVWIAALQNVVINEQTPIIHMLGPVFTSAMTEKYLTKHLELRNLSPELAYRLLNYVKTVPSISFELASSFASMLNESVNDTTVKPSDIEVWNEAVATENEIEWGSNEWHGDWAAEQQFFQSISEGRIVDLNKITTGNLGNIGGGDPVRQAKNMLIVFSVLCSRAAIMGGVSVEGSLSLSDYFIQTAEAATTVSSVNAVGYEMYHTYIQRVQKARENKNNTLLVQACKEYVQTHIFERIRLSDVALSVGYTEHYTSHKFKEETGISLFNYINEQKVEMAKNFLKGSTISIAELSARLGFTSPSYFGAVFKKITGLTPLDYARE